MEFKLANAVDILRRTPQVLSAMLEDLSVEWTSTNEGAETWSVYDIVGHLIHGERTDWIPRMEIILSNKTDKTFEPFDRFAQFEEGKESTLTDLLHEFAKLRADNIEQLLSKSLTDADLKKTGNHPAFGEVALSNLLSTWVVHDLNHIAQISRVMSKQYKDEVGPWTTYLRILQN